MEALLAADSTAGDFLDDAVLPMASLVKGQAHLLPDQDVSPEGRQIGPYRVLRLLGRGGMGDVYLAERTDGLFDRQVALKQVRSGLDSPVLVRRFEAERRILAGLQHRGIARLLDAGVDNNGLPWLAMDYVEGPSLTTYAEDHALSLNARLHLFGQVCEAVHYAHQHFVVHRDLKPNNILVTEDAQGRPHAKLLDFGIARLLDDEEGQPLTALTETGVRPMTRAYAAPEQLKGEPVTTATDVYALGALLYELLTGRRPFQAPTAAQLETAILTTEPERPSTVADSGMAFAPTRLRGDLDTIILKALRKEPAERYDSAAALSDDLDRYRTGLPIEARPPSASYRLRKFTRRHPAGVSFAALALVLLVGFTTTVTMQQRAIARERDTAQATADFLEELFSAADPFSEQRMDTLRVRDLLDLGLDRAEEQFADQPPIKAQLFYVIGNSFVRLGMHPKAERPLEEAAIIQRAESNPALGHSLSALSAVRYIQSRYEEAEQLAREAMELARQSDDEDALADAENRLGHALISLEKFDESEEVLRASITRRQSLFGEDDQAASSAELALARALFSQGRLDEAVELLTTIRNRYLGLYEPDNPRFIGVLSELTFYYLAAGRLEEAEEAGAEAVALSRAIQPGSSTLSQKLSIYASVLRRRGRLDEAENLLREAISYPPLNPQSHAIPLGTLASVLAQKGDIHGAISTQRQSLRLLQDASAPAATFSQIKLAGFLVEAGQFPEAEGLLLEAEAARQSINSSHGSSHVVGELVAPYEAWGQDNETAEWRARMDE